MSSLRHAVCPLLLTAALIWTDALAQTTYSQKRVSPDVVSGPRFNSGRSEAILYSTRVRADGAPWVRLEFGTMALPRGSYVRITSLLDGATQKLDATALEEWQHSSAYFNGPEVSVELVAA